MNDTTQLLVAGIVTILASGGFATIAVRFMERRKVTAETNLTDAQATDVLVQAGEKAVKILSEQLERALERIDTLEQENREKDLRIAQLHNEVMDLRAQVDRLTS